MPCTTVCTYVSGGSGSGQGICEGGRCALTQADTNGVGTCACNIPGGAGCATSQGLACCGASGCQNLNTHNHCGGCNNACPPGQLCTDHYCDSIMGYNMGGVDANPGEFPGSGLLQMFDQDSGQWFDLCEVALLSSYYGLTGAYCLRDMPTYAFRVRFGDYDRSGGLWQYSDLVQYQEHERWDGHYVNNLAILTFTSPIQLGPVMPQGIYLPPDNTNQFLGVTGVSAGWGPTSYSAILPDILQKASIGVISTSDCQIRLASFPGLNIDDSHICVMDPSANVVAGGLLYVPLNGGVVLAGVGDFSVGRSGGYPQVFTRTSAFLQWISDNTP
jgi:hypothetical protein